LEVKSLDGERALLFKSHLWPQILFHLAAPLFPRISLSSIRQELSHFYKQAPYLNVRGVEREKKGTYLLGLRSKPKSGTPHSDLYPLVHFTIKEAEKSHLQ
jgi:hypothetical protein